MPALSPWWPQHSPWPPRRAGRRAASWLPGRGCCAAGATPRPQTASAQPGRSGSQTLPGSQSPEPGAGAQCQPLHQNSRSATGWVLGWLGVEQEGAGRGLPASWLGGQEGVGLPAGRLGGRRGPDTLTGQGLQRGEGVVRLRVQLAETAPEGPAEALNHARDACQVVVGGAEEGEEALDGVLAQHADACRPEGSLRQGRCCLASTWQPHAKPS